MLSLVMHPKGTLTGTTYFTQVAVVAFMLNVLRLNVFKHIVLLFG